MLQQLKLLTNIDSMERKLDPEFDFLSDVDILKSFNLPLSTKLEDIHEGTLAYRLLEDRENRPSKPLWEKCMQIAKSSNAQSLPTFAAELYLEVLTKQTSEADHLHALDDAEKGGLPASSVEFDKQVLEDKKYPPTDDTMPDDAMPNIGGGMADVEGGDFKSADTVEPPKKDCKE